MAIEWVSVVLPGTDAPPALVNKEHFEQVLKDKGFVLESDLKSTTKKKSTSKEKE